ncbi:MAG TPA: phosphotransferase [Lachnospiraceae bacterium]|nr:phosphotransferase [Lachnospiraceae bacterium]
MGIFNYDISERVMEAAVRKYIDGDYSYGLISTSMNGVFEVKSRAGDFILRISHPLRYVNQIHGEIHFINYLGRNGVNVVKPLLSKGGSYVEYIDAQDKYIVCAFEKAVGKIVDYTDRAEWNPDLFRAWGKAIGRMHSLTKTYSPEKEEYRRMEWNQESIPVKNSIFDYNMVVPEGNEVVFSKWTELLKELDTLPKSIDAYGLVHCDLHSLNFFVNKGGMTIFDFDDCCYHWFSYDIAIAFYDSLYCIPFEEKERRREFIKSFSQNFFEGYNSENHLSDEWISRIPLFIKYRDFLSYLVTVTHMDIDNMDREQRSMLHNIRYALENDIPYVYLT